MRVARVAMRVATDCAEVFNGSGNGRERKRGVPSGCLQVEGFDGDGGDGEDDGGDGGRDGGRRVREREGGEADG